MASQILKTCEPYMSMRLWAPSASFLCATLLFQPGGPSAGIHPLAPQASPRADHGDQEMPKMTKTRAFWNATTGDATNFLSPRINFRNHFLPNNRLCRQGMAISAGCRRPVVERTIDTLPAAATRTQPDHGPLFCSDRSRTNYTKVFPK